jgi:hypothetical protein
MKARISTNRCRCRQCYPADLEQGALNEARAILAESEPKTHGNYVPVAPSWKMQSVRRQALAESLAAFLED